MERAPTSMPVPVDQLASFASSLLSLALFSVRPPLLERRSLPSTTLSFV